MTTTTKLFSLVLVLATVTGCDPFASQNTGAPVIQAVTLTDGSAPVEGTVAGTTWTVTQTDPAQNILFVIASKSLDGKTIQTAPPTANSFGDCTPANNWLTVASTPNDTSAGTWFTCYNPGSPIPTEGASIVIYKGTATIGGVGADWFTLSVPLATGTTYTFTGTVKDLQGNNLPIDVVVKTP